MTATTETPVDPALERVKTGVEAFDDLVMGGLPRGRTTIVGGTPGCGKTVFATQFLAHGITELGEPGVFVTFEETPAEIEVNMASFGWTSMTGERPTSWSSSTPARATPIRSSSATSTWPDCSRVSCMPPEAPGPSALCSIRLPSSSIISSPTRPWSDANCCALRRR